MSSVDDSFDGKKIGDPLSLHTNSSNFNSKEKNLPSISSPFSPPSSLTSSSINENSKRYGRRISFHESNNKSPISELSLVNNSNSTSNSQACFSKSLTLEPLNDIYFDSDSSSQNYCESSISSNKKLNLKFSPDTKIFNIKNKSNKEESKDATLSRGNLIAEFLRNQKSILKNLSEEELLIKYEQFAQEMEKKKSVIKESTDRITSIRLSESNLRRNSMRNLGFNEKDDENNRNKNLNRLTIGRKKIDSNLEHYNNDQSLSSFSQDSDEIGSNEINYSMKNFPVKKNIENNSAIYNKFVIKISTRNDLTSKNSHDLLPVSFTLDKKRITIGKDPSNTISIPNDLLLLPEKHALIEEKNGSFYLVNPINKNENVLNVASVRVNKVVNQTVWYLESGVRFVAGCSVFQVLDVTSNENSDSKLISLIILNGPYKDKKYQLTKKGGIIGRSVDCDISLQDNELSRQHLSILFDNNTNKFYLEDLNSTNGTFIQLINKYNKRYKLKINDNILIGRTGFSVNRYDYGISECIGFRTNMEDSWIVNQNLAVKPLQFLSLLNPISFYGIFDGHGGPAASIYLSRYLQLNLTHQLILESTSILSIIEQLLIDIKQKNEESDEEFDEFEEQQDEYNSLSPPTTSSFSCCSSSSQSLIPSTANNQSSPISSNSSLSPSLPSPLSVSPPLSPYFFPSNSLLFYSNPLILDELDNLIKKIIIKSFLITDSDYLSTSTNPSHGSTASTILILGSRLYCANVGDSRTILCRNFKSMALSNDHKPSRPDEAKRITEAGGIIFNNRVMGQLAITRAFGDVGLKKSNLSNEERKKESNEGYNLSNNFESEINWPLIIAEPEIEVVTITDEDQFVLLACDGLYDVMTNDEIIQFVLEHMSKYKDTEKCCHDLTTEAIKHRNSRDNVSVILVILNKWY